MSNPVFGVRRVSLLLVLVAAGLFLSNRPIRGEEFDWRNIYGQNWVSPVQDQFNGTCWAFASCGVLESKYMLTRDDSAYAPNVSEQQLVWETSPDLGDGTDGGMANDVLNYFTSHGVVLNSEIPNIGTDNRGANDPWLTTGWQNRVFKSASNFNEFAEDTNLGYIKACLKTYGPLTLRCEVDNDWYSPPPEGNRGNHAVVIVGFHDNVNGENAPGGGYWIIKNSWGEGWNGNGYGAIAYATRPTYEDDDIWHLWQDNVNVCGITGPTVFTGAMATVTWQTGIGGWTVGGRRWAGTDMYGNALASYAWENKETTAIFNSPGGNLSIMGKIIAHGVTINSGATGYIFNSYNEGALTVTGGGITTNEDVTFNVPIKIGAPQTWNIASGKWLNVGGDLHTIISNLTITGYGDATISGSIDGGGVANAAGAAPGSITINGGTYLYLTGGGKDYSVNINVANGGLVFQPPVGTSSHYWSTISGGGWIDKWGGGTAILTGGNNYSNWTSIYDGAIQADSGAGLPSGSFLNLNGGVLQSNGAATFTRGLGTSGGAFQWNTNGGGFSARDNPMTVRVGNNTNTITWGTAVGSQIVGTLKFGSSTANNVTTFQNGINFNGEDRTIYVEKNPNSASDVAVISGNIVDTSGPGWASLYKTGPGTLVLTGANNYGDNTGNGSTHIVAGALQADRGAGLPLSSDVILDGGVLQSNSPVVFTDVFWYDTPNANCISWNGGGFSAGGGKMTVNLYGDARPVNWGTDPRASIVGTMILGSTTAQYETEFQNALNLNGGVQTIQVDDNPFSSGDFAAISGPISNGGVNKTGAGILVLSGNTSYIGGTTINGGTLVLKNQTNAAFLAAGITNNATLEFNVTSGDNTYTGVVSGGGGGVNKTGAGRLILSGYNTFGDPTGYTGLTVVNEGVLQADRGVGLSPNSGLMLNGGVLQSNSAITFTDPIWYWAPDSHEVIWNGGGFSAGGGKMTVNLFGDQRTINWGTDGYQGIAGTMKLSSPSAQFETEIQNAVDLKGEVRTIFVDDNTASTGDFARISGAISDPSGAGIGGINKTGPGRLILSGANTYGDNVGWTGFTTISQGVLQADRGVGLPNGSCLVLDGGVFQSNSATTFNTGFWYDWGFLIWNNGGFAGGNGKLTVNLYGDRRPLTWGADGGHNLAGTMILNSSSAMYEVEVQNGIDLNGGARTIQVDDNSGSTGDFATLSGAISDSVGGASLTKTGPGTLVLGGSSANTFTGDMNVTQGIFVLAKTSGVAIAGTLNLSAPYGSTETRVHADNQFASSAVINFTGGYWPHFELLGHAVTIAGISDAYGTGVIENTQDQIGIGDSVLTVSNATDCSYSGIIRDHSAGSGKLSLAKGGDGTLTLTGVNSGGYTGGLTVNAGTLDYSGGALPNCNYTLNGGTLNIGAQAKSIGSLLLASGTINGSGTLSSNATYDVRSGTVNAVLAGSVGLNKTGAGTAVLTGVNSFSGNVTVSGGTLLGTSGNAFGVSSNARTITVNSGAVLNFAMGDMFGGHTNTAVPTIDIEGGTVTNSTSNVHNAFNNLILNNGLLTSTTDAGAWAAWQINGSVTASGASAITYSGGNGQIMLQSGDQATPATIFNVTGGTLSVANPIVDGRNSASIIRATGLTKTGAGTMVLTGLNSYTGLTSVSGGILQFGNGTTNAVLPANGAVYGGLSRIAFNIAAATTNTYAGTITGTGSVNKLGYGNLALTGANTFTGSLNVAASNPNLQDGAVFLGCATAPAVQGNVNMQGGYWLIAKAANQFGPNSTLYFTASGEFVLNGFNQTVAGLSDSTGNAVVQNAHIYTQSYFGVPYTAANSTLTVNNSTNFSYAGWIRDNSGNGPSGLLSLTKSGNGTLTLTGTHSGGYTGGLTVNAGTLNYSGGALPACKYTIAGGTLNIGGLSQSIGMFQITGGSVTGTGTLTSNAVYDVRGGTVAAKLAGNSGLTKSGSGTAILTGANSYAGRTTVAGGTLLLGPSAQNCVMNLGGADIQSGGISFDYAGFVDPAATIRNMLTTSYDGGLWNVGQFRDSTATVTGLTLGWLDDTSVSRVKVMATYAGDFNLDGAVDTLDRNIWAANAFRGTTWRQGDANYDGIVNGLDRDLWFAHAGLPALGGLSAAAAVVAVPEPGTLALLAAGLFGLLAYAWRKRK